MKQHASDDVAGVRDPDVGGPGSEEHGDGLQGGAHGRQRGPRPQ